MVILELSGAVHAPKSEITCVDISDVFLIYETGPGIDIETKLDSPMSMKEVFEKLSLVFSDVNVITWRNLFLSDGVKSRSPR